MPSHHERHVATEAGVEFYHLPIGSLIIAHPYIDKLPEEHRKLVYAGSSSYGVPKSAKVYVPKFTSLNDDSDVATAPKFIVMGKPGNGRMIKLDDEGMHDLGHLTQFDQDAIDQSYKTLPYSDTKYPVISNGKLLGWVPASWKTYQTQTSSGHVPWTGSMDAKGNWHSFGSNGKAYQLDKAASDSVTASLSQENSNLKEYNPPNNPNPSVTPPPGPLADKGATPATANVGGVTVDANQIASAINILNSNQSTAVKQPLKAAGHPLAGMDYHAVSKAELAAHPELKVEKGSKDKHVGQVKVAVLHHLGSKQQELGSPDAHAAKAQEAQDTAKAQAKAANATVPSKVTLGGLDYDQAKLKAGLEKLAASKAKSVAPQLGLDKAKIVQIAKEHLHAHPEHAGEGVKQAVQHAMQESHGQAVDADLEKGFTGPEQPDANVPDPQSWMTEPGWADLHGLLMSGSYDNEKYSPHESASNAIAFALKGAIAYGTPRYVTATKDHGFQIGQSAPGVDALYWRVDPNHKVVVFDGGTGKADALTIQQINMIVHDRIKPKEQPGLEPLFINGEKVGMVPKGSKIYQSAGNGDVSKRWVKSPSGQWYVASTTGIHDKPNSFDHNVEDGSLVSVGGTPSAAEAVEPDLEVKIKGKVVATVPAGSKVYHSPTSSLTADGKATSDTVALKYIHEPDGTWHKVGLNTPYMPTSGNHDSAVEGGAIVPDDGGAPAKEVSDPPIHVTLKGVIKADVPAGSTVYHLNTQSDDSAGHAYVLEPDATWHFVSTTAPYKKLSASSTKSASDAVSDGTLVEFGKESAEPGPIGVPDEKPTGPLMDALKSQAAKEKGIEPSTYSQDDMEKIKEDLKAGSVAPGKVRKAGNSPEPLIAQAAINLYHPSDDAGYLWDTAVVYEDPNDGTWKLNKSAFYIKKLPPGTMYYSLASDQNEHLSVSVQHTGAEPTADNPHPGEPVPAQQIKDIIGKFVVPDSTILGKPLYKNGPITEESKKLYKHGHYYKPNGKSHLEISGPSEGSSSYKKESVFTYWNAQGEPKTVSMAYAVKALSSNTEFHAQPKEIEPSAPAKKKSKVYVTTLKPTIGEDDLTVHLAGGETGTLAVHGDGSSVMFSAKMGEQTLDANATAAMVKSGGVADKYGNTVVVPGVDPATYFVADQQFTKPELQEWLSEFEQNYDTVEGVQKTLMHHKSKLHASKLSAFVYDKKANGWEAQRDALMGLLRNLLDVPDQKAATPPSEVKYLKGLPPGIEQPQDIYKFDDAGHAQQLMTMPVYPGTKYQVMGFSSLSATDLADKIKAVSEQYGGGKVVGTHVSSLNAEKKTQWLQAWQQGDMETVFALDSGGGKVSSVHPGAPSNEATHQINWAPFGAGEKPASESIEGDWTPVDVTLPTQEIDNYLIKAGASNPEYMDAAERRQWVVFHRKHNQQSVDAISHAAQDLKESGANPLSETPHWTDNVQPAKSYDAYWDEKTNAGSWPSQAIDDFISEKLASDFPNMNPLLQQQAEELGYSDTNSHYVKVHALDAYMQQIKDAAEAEALKPVYKKTPGGASPTSSHPIYEIQDQFGGHFFHKPTPANEKFLAEQEDAAGKLGNLWGFKTPESRLIEFNGKYGQAQAKLAPEGDLSYGQKLGFYDPAPIPWHDTTQRQVSDIAREHLLDWALDNDDGRASNFLRMPDGSVVGIDKGRAWAKFGAWNGLSGDAGADQRSAQVVTELYNAIRSHEISKDVADQAYLDVMQRASRMQRLPDVKLTAMLEQAFASRPDSYYGGKYNSKEKLIAAAVARKNSLQPDFNELWAKVYKDAGWTLPEIPEAALPSTRKGDVLHSGFSEPELLDHVNTVTVAGVPTFFGGSELEDSNVLVWREFAGKTKDKAVLRGETGTHGSAYDKVVSWSQQHQTAGPENASVVPTDQDNVKGEAGWYKGIISAAKTISYHNKQGDKQYNQSRLDEMENAKQNMQARVSVAEAAVAAGPESDKYTEFEKEYGSTPELNIDAANTYLDQISQVERAKENSFAFEQGLLPQWEAPAKLIKAKDVEEKVKEKPTVKVELKQASRNTGSLDGEGNLHTGAGALSYPGNSWHITLPTGEEIVISNGDSTGIELAHHGRIRFKANAEDGAASLERIRAQLQEMGLEMKEADESDLELFYWRHLAHVLADRVDAKDGKYGKVWADLKSRMNAEKAEVNTSTPEAIALSIEEAGLDPDTELDMWHQAWSNVTSPDQVAEFVAAQGYLPHLPHFDTHHPDVTSGDPYWMRFDMSPEDTLKQPMPEHFYTNNPTQGALNTLHSGGTLGKEERIRQLGAALSGMGNPYDSGATNFIYTRQHQEAYSSYNSGAPYLLFNPSVLARTHTYSFDEDAFGRTTSRKYSAYFDPKKSQAMANSSNETLIKNSISVLDDIELIRAHDEKQRQQIIKELAEIGIKDIRGVPVDQRVITVDHGKIPAQTLAILRAAFTTNADDINW